MRFYILTLLAGFVFITPQNALADDFGERFTGETPAGLAEGTYEPEEAPAVAQDSTAEDLQDIMPAAGDEEETLNDAKTAQEEDAE